MIPATYLTYAGQSERVIDQYDSVQIENPLTGVITTINWITLGYTDGANLDGLGNTQRSLTATGINQATGEPVTIMINGEQVAFLNIPFVCVAAQPNIALLIYNVPTVPGTVYDVIVTSTTPTGADTVIDSWTVRVTSTK
jgi:hypothetical protein